MGDDGIYVSAQQRRRRRRQIGTLVAVAAVLMGAGAYTAASWYLGRGSTVTGLPPMATPSVPPPLSATPSVAPQSAPAVPLVGTMSAARRSWLPSPVPSPTAPTDDELAATQVSLLLQPRAGILAANSATTVRNEVTVGGAQARIVSARYDLTPRWQLLGATDTGQRVGAARCTQNFQVDGSPLPQNRPGLLLCWRMSQLKSVVVIATRAAAQPQPADVAAVIAREWVAMG